MNKRIVLVVDSDIRSRCMFTEQLQQKDCKVYQANTCALALELLKRVTIHACSVDFYEGNIAEVMLFLRRVRELDPYVYLMVLCRMPGMEINATGLIFDAWLPKIPIFYDLDAYLDPLVNGMHFNLVQERK